MRRRRYRIIDLLPGILSFPSHDAVTNESLNHVIIGLLLEAQGVISNYSRMMSGCSLNRLKSPSDSPESELVAEFSSSHTHVHCIVSFDQTVCSSAFYGERKKVLSERRVLSQVI